MAKNITPRSKDYPQWYLDVIKAGDLAEHSPVRGCMIIKPQGFAVWERIQQDLDRRFKETGHVNAYFPLFIPKSFLVKEAAHVEGFAMECAVVTHSGLEPDGKGGLRPKSPLEEELIVRPTSETIIGHSFANWVQSWRDLPLLINQWANIVRWEMRTRLFLRTMEFLWQEGHTAHETAEEADQETRRMLDVYADFAEDVLAIPVIKGEKSESERFAGANHTFTIEAMMQDGKALQSGTSHNLGQNFSKAFNIQFQTRDQGLEHVYTTSWGVSTRLIGGLIMTHSDDEGLILPPKVAPIVAAIVPIYRKDAEREKVLAYARELLVALCGEERVAKAENLGGKEILSVVLADGRKVVMDLRDTLRPAEKFFHWEQRGVCLRIEVGPRDVEGDKAMVVTRHDRAKVLTEKLAIDADWLQAKLASQQGILLQRARDYRTARTHRVDSFDELKSKIEEGGFFLMHWDGSRESEEALKECKASIRCIPEADSLETADGPVSTREPGKDPISGKDSAGRVVVARAY
ncbi:MAG TPA: proline--tRNA ligase [Planctomycetes bacterium]|nr:proline--tRNA ligase [Planctomycetota bacterium]